jgi:hypothetical protein
MEENLWPFQQDKEDISIIPLTMKIRKSFSLVMARGDGIKVGTSRATEEAQFISSSTAYLDQGVIKRSERPSCCDPGSAYIKPF